MLCASLPSCGPANVAGSDRQLVRTLQLHEAALHGSLPGPCYDIGKEAGSGTQRLNKPYVVVAVLGGIVSSRVTAGPDMYANVGAKEFELFYQRKEETMTRGLFL